MFAVSSLEEKDPDVNIIFPNEEKI